ncbi:hypothetical protein H5410_040899 [Solanum commersonii]|uniref:Uncharacterized protein n=1 Tax=Solanum commersonii TaxID=4109 RepID=A0A9J5XQ99_SOLCO|nr:hypothetical protein H5410_040899 [Solanum commersonii]
MFSNPCPFTYWLLSLPFFPYDEGGISVRNLKDVCIAFQYKQWWIFRSKHTLWGDFLKAKYCQRSNPINRKKGPCDSST